MSPNKAENKTKKEITLVPLSHAAKKSGYTPEYLNFLSRKGILKAEKIGRNWHTTHEWLEEFLTEAEKLKKEKGRIAEEKVAKSEILESQEPEVIVTEINGQNLAKKIDESIASADKTRIVRKVEKVEDEEFLKVKKTKSTFFQFMAGLSSAVIIIPIIFLSIYLVKNTISYRQSQEEKIAAINSSPQGIILNENGTATLGSASQGIVKGENTNASDDQAKQAGIILASENYKASQVSLGEGIVLADAEESQPLEISDINSESFIVSKNNGPSGNSSEEVKLLVSWKTNKLAMSELDYSKNNGQNPQVIKEQSFGFNHSVVLTQIDPGTSYIYQIKGNDHWGNEVDSDFYGIFTTSKPVSVFDLISQEINDIFGWAIKK